MRKFLFFIAVWTILCFHANAKPRTQSMMKRAAAEVLASHTAPGSKNAMPVKLLHQRTGLAVYGYQEGGFAVIAEDDMFPAVLGYSKTPYHIDTPNENFKWWLNAMEKVVSEHRTTPLKIIKPDTDKHAPSVAPLIKTKWGQDYPYSLLVPSGCPTGCVATAASQVLRFNEWPDWGVGEPYTFYPFGDFEGTCLKEDISQAHYSYGAMLNEYGWSSGDSRQRRAVALLMYHVGLAMKAQYDWAGTGSYSVSLCYGLRNHLKYPLAVTIERDRYTDEEWMDIIFTQLSNGLPLIYGGADETYTGHEFVLHGYNSQGKIYINWGWDGDLDGYFDIAHLYAGSNLSLFQDMVIRCSPDMIDYEPANVVLSEPGTLEQNLSQWQKDSIVGLSLAGPLNGTDLRLLREMAGADAYGHGTYGHLSFLDLSEAYFVEGGEPYKWEEDSAFLTHDDEIPAMAFADCSYLIDVTLPNKLKSYGGGIFANCYNLDTVKVVADDMSDFCVEGRFVLSNDRKELIECLPGQDVHYMVPEGVKTIHGYAFAGRYLYERVSLPASVDSIGVSAFNRCFDLRRTYLFSEQPPVIDPSAIDPLDLSLRYIYVPKGSKALYKKAEGWKRYGSKIYEFDAEAGVDNVKLPDEPQSDDVYSVDGRRVGNSLHNLPTGTYIMNGKKYRKK